MGHKYFLWGGERWRELNSASGEVAGWSRRARFVVVRRGRLRLASRRRVLAALQAHAASLPSAVGLGPRLSALNKEPAPLHTEMALPKTPPPTFEHHHCCMCTHRCQHSLYKACSYDRPAVNNDVSTPYNWTTRNGVLPSSATDPNNAPKPNEAVVNFQRCNASTHACATSEAAVQQTACEHQPLTINIANVASLKKPYIPTQKTNPGGPRGPRHNRAPALDALLRKHSNPIKRPRSATSDSEETNRGFRRPSKKRRSEDTQTQDASNKPEQSVPVETKSASLFKRERRAESESSEETDAVCKELTISESDVSALRSYVARTRSDALARFDADDSYKRMLFYAINPLVDVERCRYTERALRDRRPLALPPFAARLGLAPLGAVAGPAPRVRARPAVAYRERSSSPDTDKENKNKSYKKTRGSSSKNVVLRTKSNAEDSDSGDDRSGFLQSRDRKRNALRQSTALNRAHAKLSDSEKESNLFQNSRKVKLIPRSDNKKSAAHKFRKNTVVASEVSTSEDSDSTFKSESKHKNRAHGGNRRESLRPKTTKKFESSLDSSESDYKTKIFKKSKNNPQVNRAPDDKRQETRRSRTVEAHKSTTDDTSSDEKSEALRSKEDKPEDRRLSANRRGSLRSKAVTPKPDTKHAKSDVKGGILKRIEIKPDSTRASSDKGQILKTKTVNNKCSSDDSETDDKATKNSNRIRDSILAPNDKRRKSMRHKTANKESECDKKHENLKNNKKPDYSDVSNGNKRESLRHNTANNINSNTRDSESDEKNERMRINVRNHDTSRTSRHKTANKVNSRSRDSESEEKSEISKRKDEKISNSTSSNTRRESLRDRSVTQSKPSAKNSDIDQNLGTNKQSHKKKETNHASSDNKNNKGVTRPKHNAPSSEVNDSQKPSHNKRVSLRRRSKSNLEKSGSDNRQLTHSSREQNHRTTLTPAQKYVAESDSSTSHDQFVTRSKSFDSQSKGQHRSESARNGNSSIDSRDTGVFRTKTVKDPPLQTKSSNDKIQPPSKHKDQARADARPSKASHIISKRVSSGKLKEYSNLEDHAIVAWVSGGGRARRVNGNMLWRELQEQYPRLTGHSRSWHSLRNRYLRYILPALGALHLPPADVSRLRAAAATGETKSKRAGTSAPRRNSIFDQSAVQAASRSAPASGDGAEKPPGKIEHFDEAEGASSKRRSLRSYFVAPRRFDDSDSLRPAAAEGAPRPRQRKLFSHKLLQ